MHTYIDLCTDTDTRTHADTQKHRHRHRHRHVDRHTDTHTHTRTQTDTQTHIIVREYMCVCVTCVWECVPEREKVGEKGGRGRE